MLKSDNRLYDVGIYCRLSREDKPLQDEKVRHSRNSVSIGNQVSILTDYAITQGWNVKGAYSDDGYSGGNFERPAFLRMLEDAKVGKINLILVKDLSRLGRDSVGVGTYTDQVFPSLGCRFVALSDGIDTALNDNDIMPFLALINDYHLKDISRKIKSVLKAKAENGECMITYVPYGYKKDENDKHKIIVDDFSSEIVKGIFELRLQKKGYAAIARNLNERKILPPKSYWNSKNGKENKAKFHHLWRDTTVKSILKNDIYLGHLTQLKTGTLSYKNQKQITKDSSDWVKTENTHEAIIDEETWNAVQQVDLRKYTTMVQPQKSLFSGLLQCMDCKSNLSCNSESQKRLNGNVVRYCSYACPIYYQTGRSSCSSHRIYEIGLIKIIKADILQHMQRVKFNEPSVKTALKTRLCKGLPESEQIENETKALRKRLGELDKMAVALYEDKLGGAVSEETFISLIGSSEVERAEKSKRLEKLEQIQGDVQKSCLNIEKWLELIRKYADVEIIDRELLDALISKIEIGKREVIDGVKHQDIKIIYRFIGSLDD